MLTLVLYFGLDRWNAAKTLYEAIQISDRLKRFIPDLPINLIEVAWLTNEVIDQFKSDFKSASKRPMIILRAIPNDGQTPRTMPFRMA